MGLKGQTFLLTSIIIIVFLTILELNIFNFNKKNLDTSLYDKIYFEKTMKEFYTLPALTNIDFLENFIDFLFFEKKHLESKNYKLMIFSVVVTNEIKNKINITIVNFLDKDIDVRFKLNTTPEQEDSIFLQNKKYYSKIFNIDDYENYNLEIYYDNNNFNMTLNFNEKNNLFIFFDVNFFSEKTKYIDKLEKSYYFT